MTQAEELFRGTVSVGEMFPGAKDRVVVEEAVEDVNGFPRGARYRTRREDRMLVRDVGINADRPVVVADVPGVKGRQKRTRLDLESLAVR